MVRPSLQPATLAKKDKLATCERPLRLTQMHQSPQMQQGRHEAGIPIRAPTPNHPSRGRAPLGSAAQAMPLAASRRASTISP